MSPTEIRFEQPYRPEVAFKVAAVRERSDRTSALIVMGLSLACTAMAMFDLLLLASGH
jgi:hypothetical protein